MFIKRNQAGEIIAISKVMDGDINEYLPNNAVELHTFVHSTKDRRQQMLAQSDLDMARVLEDVVNLLIERNLIRFTDLPDAAQNKLLSRRELRDQDKGINLLDDGDDLHL